jgi:hypothetical protein
MPALFAAAVDPVGIDEATLIFEDQRGQLE